MNDNTDEVQQRQQEVSQVGVDKTHPSYPTIPSVSANIQPKMELFYQFDNDPPVKFGESANPRFVLSFNPELGKPEVWFKDKVKNKKFKVFAKEIPTMEKLVEAVKDAS